MAKNTMIDGDIYTATIHNATQDQIVVTHAASKPTGVDGQFAYDTTNNRREHYDGSAWIGRTDDDWTTFSVTYSNFTLGDGTEVAKYKYVENVVFWQVEVTLGSTSSVSGAIGIGLPVTAADAQRAAATATGYFKDGSTRRACTVYDNSTSEVRLGAVDASSTYASVTATSATIPHPWASGDDFIVGGWYEPA